jgi:hypothetical protein
MQIAPFSFKTRYQRGFAKESDLFEIKLIQSIRGLIRGPIQGPIFAVPRITK